MTLSDKELHSYVVLHTVVSAQSAQNASAVQLRADPQRRLRSGTENSAINFSRECLHTSLLAQSLLVFVSKREKNWARQMKQQQKTH